MGRKKNFTCLLPERLIPTKDFSTHYARARATGLQRRAPVTRKRTIGKDGAARANVPSIVGSYVVARAKSPAT